MTVNVTAPAAPAAPAALGSPTDREALFWTSIKDGTDPVAFEAYLKQYPGGTFAALARQRVVSLGVARFDGTWDVTVVCPVHTDGALGFTYRFLAQVKDGILDGQHSDREGLSVTFKGKIQPDGSANLEARGVTADPKYSVGGVKKGTPFGWRAPARFEGSRGTGTRTELRICHLAFVKQ